MKKIKQFIYLHKFFVKESRYFVGKWRSKPHTPLFKPWMVVYGGYAYSLKDLLRYPFAYVRFMYYSLCNR